MRTLRAILYALYPMILIIDNYDSFVFNIARSFRELGEDVVSLMVDIKKVFDPENLMNPGKVVPLP